MTRRTTVNADLISAEMAAAEEAESRDVLATRSRWSPAEKGYIEVVNLADGEVVEIPYQQATEVWKEDARRLRRARATRDGRRQAMPHAVD